MTLHKPFQGKRNLPAKLIPLLGCLLILAVLFSSVGRASAAAVPVAGVDPLRERDPVPAQVAPEQDASLSSLSVTASGETVALVPQFDPATMIYTATVDAETVSVSATAAGSGAVINRTSVGDDTTDLDSPGSMASTDADLAEGATTVVSMRVLAADEATTETYYVLLSRPADPSVPDITIEAENSEYVAGIGPLIFTLTRDGDTADSLDVNANLVQAQEWLSDVSETATFAAGDSETALIIPATVFSSSVTRIGDLVATLAPVAGYDAGGAARVRIISQEGPAVTVSIEHPTYTVAEDAGTLDVVVVARAHSSVPRVDGFNVAVLTDPDTASSDPDSGDYLDLSSQLRFNPSDFQMENGALEGRKTVSVTIIDDDAIEGDELFHLHLGQGLGNNRSETTMVDPQGEVCGDACPNPYVVTITDNDPAVTVQFGQNAYTVVEGGTQDVTVTLSDDPQRTVVVPITITDQDGATGDDYSGVPQTVTFNTGETSQTIPFAATDDTAVDDGESVMLSFGETLPAGVTEGTVNQTVVSITDNDPAVTVSFGQNAYTVVEGGTQDVTVTLSDDPQRTVVVPITITDQDGATGDDYSGVPQTVTFNTGETSQTIPFAATDDTAVDDGESVMLSFGETLPAGVTEGTVNQTVVSITDNDPAVTVSFGQNAYTVVEGGTQDVTVTLSDDPQRTVVVPITITDQDGATGDDYSGVPQTVTFNTGETSSTFTLIATRDTDYDDGESVKLSFGSMLPGGVTEGHISETVVSLIEFHVAGLRKQPGISVPRCESSGIFVFWRAGIEFDGDPPPHGWRVERRHRSNKEWITARFDFLGPASDALQTYSDEYWDWTDTTRRLGVDYTYRVHALDNNGELLEGRNWSRRAEALCP